MFNIDRLLAIIGVVLAVPGIIILFQSPRLEEGFLFAALLFLTIAYFIHLYWWEFQQYFFTHLEVDKTITFKDSRAKVAQVQTTIRSRVSHSGITQLWFRNFQPGSKYQNVMVDGEPPGSTKTKGGNIEFCKEFDRPLLSGQPVEVKVSYEIHDAFPLNDPDESFVTHIVATRTKKLKLRIRFHDQMIGRNIRGIVSYGSGGAERTRDITVNAGIAEYQIENPKTSARYTIEWDW